MERCYDYKQYIDTVKQNDDFFRKYYFHSIIDLNLVKLDYILKNGILSRKKIEQLNLLSFYVHSTNHYNCKNGMNYISLVDYNKLYETINFEYGDTKCEPSFNQCFEAFALHTLTSLSIIINKEIEIYSKGQREPLFDDEIFAKDKIDKNCFEGIVLPEHIANKRINEIAFLTGDAYSYAEKNIDHLIEQLEIYFGKKIDRSTLMQSVKQAWDICYSDIGTNRIASSVEIQREKYGIDMKDILASIMNDLWQEKIGIENPRYIDVVKYLNDDQYPIYEIGTKQLRKSR